MAFALNRQQRGYAIIETTFGTVPAITGSNCFLVTKMNLRPNVDLLEPESKTGTRTQVPGVKGRSSGKFTVEVEIRGNGTAGTAPDIKVLLQALFGQAPTVVASTSVTYNLSDSIPSFSLFNYRQVSSVMQQVACGCVVTKATFQLGENLSKATFTGDALWVVDSVNFSTLDIVGQGQLGAFPTEPSSPTTNGAVIAGFTGSFQNSTDSNTLANVRTATIEIDTGNAIPLDVFGSYYGGPPEGDVRKVTLAANIYDDDSTGNSNLYTKAVSKAPVNFAIQIGQVAGNIYTFTIKGVQLATPDLQEGQRKWTANFEASRASGSSLTALDEIKLALT